MLLLLGIVAILAPLAMTGLHGTKIARFVYTSSPELFILLVLLYFSEVGLGIATIVLLVSKMLE